MSGRVVMTSGTHGGMDGLTANEWTDQLDGLQVDGRGQVYGGQGRPIWKRHRKAHLH